MPAGGIFRRIVFGLPIRNVAGNEMPPEIFGVVGDLRGVLFYEVELGGRVDAAEDLVALGEFEVADIS